jgi:prevent-host-death family protein
MAKTISKSQFKPKSLELFRTVEQTGEELIITDHGRPVLKIVPYSEDPEQWFKGLRNTVIRYERPFEPVGQDDWEALK